MHRRGALDRPRGPLPTRFQDTPELPPACSATLDAGLRALDLRLPDGAREALDGHLRLLLAWTGSINLTAIRDPLAATTLHVLDSLAAAPLLRAAAVDRLLDLGSGGGYPGLPLAVALSAEALLVDSIAKKAVFLRTTVDALDVAARVWVATDRAEDLAADPREREAWPAVVARAVAALPELVELALPFVAVGGLLVAWKRTPLDAELDAARPMIGQLGGAPPEVHTVPVAGLEEHRLVTIRKRSPTPVRFPRTPSERRRTRR